MKPNEAKKIVEDFLTERGIEFLKLTAKTVSFEDLARDSKVFVTVYNSPNGMYWHDLQKIAIENNFRITGKQINPVIKRIRL